MHYLTRRNHWFYFRQAIPRALQASFGKRELCHPLHTQDAKEAKIRAYKLACQLLEQFREISAVKRTEEPTVHEVLANIQQAKKFENKVHPVTGRIYIENAAPGEDYANAVRERDKANAELDNLGVIGRDCTIDPAKAKAVAAEAQQQSTYLAGSKSKNIHGAVHNYYTDKKKLKSIRHYKEAIDGFVNWITAQHPNITVNRLRKDHLRDYKRVLESQANEKRNKGSLDERTVWKKLSFIRSFLIYCQQNDWLPTGASAIPTFGVIGNRPDPLNNPNSYVRFGQEELSQIFNPSFYQDNIKLGRPHLYWFPLLGAYTGARSDEIENMDLNLIENNNPEKIWMMTIHGNVKTGSSNRTIPVHPKLIELGFFDYLEDLKRYFPNANRPFPYYKDVEGDGFIRYITKLGIKQDGKKVFHSWRKNVSHLLYQGGCPDKLSKYYTGHLAASVHKNIYEGFENPLERFSKYLADSIVYPVDVDAIKYREGMFDKFLKKSAIKSNGS